MTCLDQIHEPLTKWCQYIIRLVMINTHRGWIDDHDCFETTTANSSQIWSRGLVRNILAFGWNGNHGALLSAFWSRVKTIFSIGKVIITGFYWQMRHPLVVCFCIAIKGFTWWLKYSIPTFCLNFSFIPQAIIIRFFCGRIWGSLPLARATEPLL
jgi:hypothetical protein